MPSDRDLVQRRDADELRFLKEHVAKIRSDPRVSSATDAYENAAPIFTLEAFRTGVFIDGFPCRMTVGTLALLRGTQSRCLGYGKDIGPLEDQDIAQAVFLLSDDDRNEAVSVADDPDELAVAVWKFSKRLNFNRAAEELYEFLRRHEAALVPEGQGDETPDKSIWQRPDDAWADDVDLLAHEHGGEYSYLLWEVPLLFVVRIKESIVARRTNRRRTSRRDKSGLELLKAVEEVGKELKEKSGT